MTIKETIEKAIEGGYLGGKSFAKYRNKSGIIVYEVEDYVTPKPTMTISEAFLDPLFWKSLGKAMSWGEVRPDGVNYKPEWLWRWHLFIDHLAKGKNPKSFFENL